ncbi:hypothetical protein VB620_19340 [Nodularia harveyana UHCC-0300]|uniref:Uncharacterized protein n=1 Tax=Nodularia harveyana UHCC-0300 TaxID=2974287 RepID=A0ABU5UM31_9CYAN|nr:hypothetical protein [Nodularia harveyana]MEA5583486.1 hypothetical protein [Nodularia harveyana UHCC-0300]
MLTFILASGYLFTVYVLLALAKRSGNNSDTRNLPASNRGKQESDVSLTAHVSEVVNSQ